jgi:hypothetical protein
MGDTIRSLILDKKPTLIFGVTEFLFASLALGPTPAFVPLVLLLTIIRIHGLRIACRSTRVLELLYSWVAVTAGASLAHYSSATNALSSSSQAFAAVAVMSAITYVLAILPFYVDIRLNRKFQTIWSQITLFPVAWATTWTIVSHISPVGRLLNWSPVSPYPFHWLLPYTGPMGIDWAVGACVALCSEVAAAWLMGTDSDDQLVNLSTSRSEAQSNRRSRSLLTLGTFLVALSIPSLHSSLPARIDTIVDSSPLGVACALPSVRKGQHATLDDFITETKKLTSQAKVILWPESAVVFNSREEREAAFELLRKDIQKSVVGVAFEEFLPEDSSNPGESRMRRNGLALVNGGQAKGEEVVQYYKRNLVPRMSYLNVILPSV